ncbi:Hypothetical predicted protein [Octopus vulgaris]|uniref:Uncharacterized protein n=1 Tax=Octopus vulgaris TaxID=6645 RepID=A0AA36B126_OCTVU|nr:Hypothetical predicted protein [Octopus vulgaris]
MRILYAVFLSSMFKVSHNSSFSNCNRIQLVIHQLGEYERVAQIITFCDKIKTVNPKSMLYIRFSMFKVRCANSFDKSSGFVDLGDFGF